METALQQSAATAGGGMRPAGAATTVKKARQELELEQERELRFPQAAAAADQGGLDEELRRGPWTVDEDLTLINYIADHGEGRWNALARAAGLKRTGKSCRLRWLNYLRPDVKRGDFTADEQLLILDLHSRWGNRWSKIAAHLPGRTDNEIKNYWRTRVQKHAKQLNCDVNSKRFKDAMRFLWMPRLAERAATAAHQPQPQHVAAACNNVLVAAAAAANSSSCCWSSPRSSAVTTAACSGSSSCSSLTSESAHNDDDGGGGGDGRRRLLGRCHDDYAAKSSSAAAAERAVRLLVHGVRAAAPDYRRRRPGPHRLGAGLLRRRHPVRLLVGQPLEPRRHLEDAVTVRRIVRRAVVCRLRQFLPAC
uniref:Uncharacterized protein n=1 Tax=Zea mays TaxID=4577 RepID=A0A804NJG2_MAIZE